MYRYLSMLFFFFFQAEDGIRDVAVTGVQTCALPICPGGLPRGGNSRVAREPDPEDQRNPAIRSQGHPLLPELLKGWRKERPALRRRNPIARDSALRQLSQPELSFRARSFHAASSDQRSTGRLRVQ